MNGRGGTFLRAAAWATLMIGVAIAEPADFEGKPVLEIRFEPALQPLPLDELLARVPLRTGAPYRAALVRQAIERLYASGRFDDIMVDVTEESGGVRVTFGTVNRWFVGRQAIEGEKDPPSETKILNVTKLRLGQEFTEGNLRQATENVVNLLRSNGLYEAKVDTEIDREPETEQVDVRFLIAPGRRALFGPPIVRGDTTRTPDSILRTTGWKRFWGLGPFQKVTESRVQAGLDRIRRSFRKTDHLMGRALLLGLDYDPAANRASPLLEIFDGPKVDVTVSGIRMSGGKRRELLPIYQERSVDRELLLEGARNIEQWLQSRGYFDARASFATEEGAERRSIRYEVDRGNRFRLTAIQIDGNRYFDRDTIEERLSILPATALRYRNGRFSTRLLEGDRARIVDLYRSNGFLDAQVRSAVNTTEQGKRRLQTVQMTIQEGTQYLIGQMTFEGVDQRTEQGIRERMQISPGQPYSEQNLAADRDAILNTYFNNGYTEATLDWTATPGGEPNTVDLAFRITEGPRKFVRRVIVGGIERTDPKLVYNRISLKPGDPLSLGEILESQRRLYDLGIFARVDTAIQNPDGDTDAKYVLIEVDEASRYTFTGGIGAQIGRFGTGVVQNFESPGGAAGFSPRVNAAVTRNNFFGLGHQLNVQGRVSNIQQRAQATYLAPHFRDRDTTSIALSTFFDNSRDVRTFAARRIEGALQWTERLSPANTFQLRYAIRRVSVDAASLKIQPQLVPRLAQPVRLGIISTTFIQDRRDDPIDSKKGIYNTLDAALSINGLGSQANFFRIIGRNSSYHQITRDLIFARTINFGLQERLFGGPTRDVPLPELFFAGGAVSHRGFPENQAGPRDPVTGFPLGGKALLILGHELRYPLIGDNLGIVFFHDMGNVYSRLGNISFRANQRNLRDFDYMVQTAGIGFRYRTPIGPIRIDLGYSPNSPRFFGFEGTPQQLLFGQGRQTTQRIGRFQFHFSLGQTF